MQPGMKRDLWKVMPPWCEPWGGQTSRYIERMVNCKAASLRLQLIAPELQHPVLHKQSNGLGAIHQKCNALHPGLVPLLNEFSYRFQNIRFERALVVEEGRRVATLFSLPRYYWSLASRTSTPPTKLVAY